MCPSWSDCPQELCPCPIISLQGCTRRAYCQIQQVQAHHRAPLCMALAKQSFYLLTKILLGSCPPRTWMPSFWREPTHTAWQLHIPLVAKLMAMAGPWNKEHSKWSSSLCQDPPKEVPKLTVPVEALAVCSRLRLYSLVYFFCTNGCMASTVPLNVQCEIKFPVPSQPDRKITHGSSFLFKGWL